jgi:hypothetical protein
VLSMEPGLEPPSYRLGSVVTTATTTATATTTTTTATTKYNRFDEAAPNINVVSPAI